MIHVAIASDNNFWPYVPTLVRSIVYHASEPVTVHLLLRVSDEVRKEAERLVQITPIRIHDPAAYLTPDDAKKWRHGRITLSTMDRLLLPMLLPDVQKMMYIDVDTIVLDDIAPLMKCDCGPRGIMARASFAKGYKTLKDGIKTFGPREQVQPTLNEMRRIHINENAVSFNAGVLLMDLDRLRFLGMTEWTLSWVRNFGMNDQMALALFCEGGFAKLDASWNVYITHYKKTRPWRIIHWVGTAKPWNCPSLPLREYWLKFNGQNLC